MSARKACRDAVAGVLAAFAAIDWAATFRLWVILACLSWPVLVAVLFVTAVGARS